MEELCSRIEAVWSQSRLSSGRRANVNNLNRIRVLDRIE